MAKDGRDSHMAHAQERAKAGDTFQNIRITQDDGVNEKILGELRQLNSIQAAHLTDDSTTKVQALWTFILQFLGVGVGVLFGVFSALSWQKAIDAGLQADRANDLSEAANFMAIAAYCQSQTSGSALCSAVQSAAPSKVSVYASVFYAITASAPLTSRTTMPVPTRTSCDCSKPTGISAGTSPRSGTSDIHGVVVGSVLGLVAASTIAYIQYYIYKQKIKGRDIIRRLAKISGEKNPLFLDEY